MESSNASVALDKTTRSCPKSVRDWKDTETRALKTESMTCPRIGPQVIADAATVHSSWNLGVLEARQIRNALEHKTCALIFFRERGFFSPATPTRRDARICEGPCCREHMRPFLRNALSRALRRARRQ